MKRWSNGLVERWGGESSARAIQLGLRLALIRLRCATPRQALTLGLKSRTFGARERERVSPRWERSLGGALFPTLEKVHPLPAGEGRGEGESSHELNRFGSERRSA